MCMLGAIALAPITWFEDKQALAHSKKGDESWFQRGEVDVDGLTNGEVLDRTHLRGRIVG